VNKVLRPPGPWAPGLGLRLVGTATLVLLPRLASAHAQVGAVAGFVSGFRHPLSGWDHILAMVSVGLWGAQLGAPALWLLPVAFPMMMAFGGMLGLLGMPLPGVEGGIAVSAIGLGLMVALEARPALRVSLAIVAFFAIFHGYAHGSELQPGTSATLYSLGFVVATGCLHGVGILIGLVHKWPRGRQALRAAGALVAVAGFFFLWRVVA
jgi:urease accessory protein